jgi:cell division transport system ATP-binding protein
MSFMIYFDNVSKLYDDGRSAALQGVTFQVSPKEFVSIVGHSGAGKTTLLKMIIAEDKPSEGQVFFESIDVHRIPRTKLPHYRRKIGTVFRTLSSSLIKLLTKISLLLWRPMVALMKRLRKMFPQALLPC